MEKIPQGKFEKKGKGSGDWGPWGSRKREQLLRPVRAPPLMTPAFDISQQNPETRAEETEKKRERAKERESERSELESKSQRKKESERESE